MKINCLQEDLTRGIQTVGSAVAGRATLPILTNILLEAKKEKIELSATDLEIGIKCSVPAQVKKEGAITISAKRFSDIVRELPEGPIEMETEDSQMKISSSGIFFKVLGLPAEEFPTLSGVESENRFSLDSQLLRGMVQKTIFANSRDETRYILNGSYLEMGTDRIIMTATDGHRLATISHRLEKGPKKKIGAIIPTKALNELNRLLEEPKKVEATIGENQISFSLDPLGPASQKQAGGIILSSKLIEGQFPNYTQLIPKKSAKRLSLNREKLLKGVKRAALLADVRTGAVELLAYSNKLIIRSQTPQVGEAREEMDIDYSGEEIRTAYNARYILDILRNISSEEVTLELNDPLSPGVIRPVSDEVYLCVIMPMRIT
ncbi:DNA polymerase III subunit beta [bacterium]|nr:DNA polymerase III subunit beta [bacterium]